MKPTLPVIRVTKVKAGTVTKPPQALDSQMYDLLFKSSTMPDAFARGLMAVRRGLNIWKRCSIGACGEIGPSDIA